MAASEPGPGAIRARHCGVVLLVAGTAVAAPAVAISVLFLMLQGVHPTMSGTELTILLAILAGSCLMLAGCWRIARARHGSLESAATGAWYAAIGGVVAGLPGPVLIWSTWSERIAAGVTFYDVARRHWHQLALLFPILVAAVALYTWAAYLEADRHAS